MSGPTSIVICNDCKEPTSTQDVTRVLVFADLESGYLEPKKLPAYVCKSCLMVPGAYEIPMPRKKRQRSSATA